MAVQVVLVQVVLQAQVDEVALGRMGAVGEVVVQQLLGK
jgi:hypothetical protein